MNVELTIQEMFDNYPGLFKERADCLSQLFCTIGNGYSWIDGELILNGYEDLHNKDLVEELENKLVDGKAFQHNKLSLRAESMLYEEERKNNGFYDNIPTEEREELENARRKTINNLPDDVYYRYPRNKRWGFYINIPGREEIRYYKKSAYLWNYPEDIKPDWLDAIEECKALLREDGYDV